MIVQGDARHLPLRDRSIQCVVTSPPYWGLRDYGVEDQIGLESSLDLYIFHLLSVFKEVRRVLRDDGTLWVNLGDTYSAIGGAQARETKNPNSGIPVYQPNRMPIAGLKPKDLVGVPWRVAFALQADGWYLRSDIIWAKPNPMPESVTDRPTKAHEYLFLLAKSERYYYDAEAIKEPTTYSDPRIGTERYRDVELAAERYGNGTSASRRTAGNAFGDGIGRNRRSVWTIATQPYPEAHFATFPEDLVKPCILAGAPPGGRVLDPFAGSGTVVKVAQDLGRHGIGVELKPDYIGLAQTRTAQMGLIMIPEGAP